VIAPELTPAASRALHGARQWAGRLSAAKIQPRHLLLALVDEEEGRAARLLVRLGLSPSALRQALAPEAAAADLVTAAALPMDESISTILRQARHVALEASGERTVAGDHLLLALLHCEPKLVAQLGVALNRDAVELATAGECPALELNPPLDLSEPAERMTTARILDAAANRAREGLRVLEDYARFALDDRLLSSELKEIRHELARILAEFPAHTLLTARDTLRDVGTQLTSPGEGWRGSSRDVVQANCKRLQEALRSLEEFAKTESSRIGQALEKLRYRSYVVERALVLGTSARQRLAEARLQVLVTGARCAAGLEWTVREAIAGGAHIIQLREKTLADRDLLERARQVRRWTRQDGALFVMNDRPDLARLAGADGVHLGQEEMPVLEARRIVGPDALIGVSTHNLDQVRQAVLDGVSYIGVGPAFPSTTKTFEHYPGLEFVHQATRETTLPAFVIGGIHLENIAAAVQAGARLVAVSEAVCRSADPRAAAAALLSALNSPRN
jgi:thiamine-phosphate pyrophosphorylase